ncbi:response regulator [Caenimonas sedimenti]|uniref:Response regulator n=1 Tax=Caenimonas sedimenti TaxID=2596921 RepID=A0A562ZW28_9BURK|nr:response regulator [Caenimonas sedimenti]TWO72577.1 response regulator [Caenimonas sedimenti]
MAQNSAMAVLLLIEDDDAQRFVAAFALKKAGHSVHEAADGPSGLALAREIKPEAIVCDVMMPGMTGYEVVTELRQDAEIGHTPFVLLTAMSDRKQVRKGMTSGADDYLTKPYRPEELCEAVDAVLERRLSQQEAFLSSVSGVVEDALLQQKEHLGRRYEQQLAKEVSARWERKADAKGDLHYENAVLLQADLLGPGANGTSSQEGLAERVKRAHQQARDTLYLFGADHVLPYGADLLSVFAGDSGTATMSAELRAARAAFALGKAAPGACGLHRGPVSLVAVHDELHDVQGHSIVPGPAVSSVGGMRDHARSAGWRVAASSAAAEGLQGQVATGQRATTAQGEQAVELLPLEPG